MSNILDLYQVQYVGSMELNPPLPTGGIGEFRFSANPNPNAMSDSILRVHLHAHDEDVAVVSFSQPARDGVHTFTLREPLVLRAGESVPFEANLSNGTLRFFPNKRRHRIVWSGYKSRRSRDGYSRFLKRASK